jgi:hypothetical protein
MRESALSNLWFILSFSFLLIAIDNFTEITLISKVLPLIILVIKSRAFNQTSSISIVDVLIIYSIGVSYSYSKIVYGIFTIVNYPMTYISDKWRKILSVAFLSISIMLRSNIPLVLHLILNKSSTPKHFRL